MVFRSSLGRVGSEFNNLEQVTSLVRNSCGWGQSGKRMMWLVVVAEQQRRLASISVAIILQFGKAGVYSDRPTLLLPAGEPAESRAPLSTHDRISTADIAHTKATLNDVELARFPTSDWVVTVRHRASSDRVDKPRHKPSRVVAKAGSGVHWCERHMNTTKTNSWLTRKLHYFHVHLTAVLGLWNFMYVCVVGAGAMSKFLPHLRSRATL